jgi:hypothetical protein
MIILLQVEIKNIKGNVLMLLLIANNIFVIL